MAMAGITNTVGSKNSALLGYTNCDDHWVIYDPIVTIKLTY